MRPLAIAFVVLICTAYSNMALIDSMEVDDILEEPVEGTTAIHIEKRDTEKEENSQESFNTFIEEKLMQQSQALEHLVQEVDNSRDMIKKLIENLSKGLEQPKLPEKAKSDEVHHKRKHNISSESKDHPIMTLGKNIPKYGKLAKDLLLKAVNTDTDPTPFIEQDTSKPLLELGSRRSFGGNPMLIPSDPSQQSDDTKVNPWCPMALLCERTVDPICGFDDEFGYGRFEDFCHMLRVNCYWKYSFAMVNSCSPKL